LRVMVYAPSQGWYWNPSPFRSLVHTGQVDGTLMFMLMGNLRFPVG
jgi:hypothetical protein